jgi:hypothetical protein
MKFCNFLLPAKLASLLALCATSACTYYGTTEITSDPPGAVVVSMDTNSQLGSTPLQYTYTSTSRLPKMLTFRVQKEGYVSKVSATTLSPAYTNLQDSQHNHSSAFVELKKK